MKRQQLNSNIYNPTTTAMIVMDKDSNKTYKPVFSGTKLETDYGLITKMPNPYDPEKAIFLFTGAHTFGLAGAARMLTRPYVSRIAKEVRKGKEDYWQALVCTEVRGLQVFPELEVFKPLKRNLFLTKKVSVI